MRGKNTTKKTALALGAAAAWLLGGIAAAPVAVAQEGRAILEEITVTAQRREERIEDVPISVSAFDGERLGEILQGGEDIRAIAGRIPSVNAESSNGRVAPRFYIRGLGNTDFDLAASQPVSIIVDEVVLENVILKSFPLFDIQRVEVLRGPQGTLFGRNTPAGIIKFDTRKPSQELDGYLSATLGYAGTANLEFALGGSLNEADTLMARVSILSQERDDWIDNSFTGEKDALGSISELAGRVQLLYEPNDEFSALLNVHHRDYDGTSSIFRANVLTTGREGLNSNFDRDRVAFNEGDNNPQTARAVGGSLRLDFDVADAFTLTSITALEKAEDRSLGDIDGGNPNGPGFIPFQTSTADSIPELTQVTQEFRLSATPSDQLFWQAGAFLFDSDFQVRTEPFFVGDTVIEHTNDAWAVFGQVSYDVSDVFNLTGGLRYTDDEKKLYQLEVFGNPIDRTLLTDVQDDEISWDLSALYRMNDDVNLFARIATGFRGPSIQGRDIAFFGSPSTAASETVTSFEVGFKSTLMANRVRLNGSIFHYTMDDQQLTAVGGTGNQIRLINADKTNGTGFDFDTEILFSEYSSLTLGVAWNDTEIDDPGLRIPVCGSGACTPVDPLDANGFAIVDGNPLPNAPEWNASLNLRLGTPVQGGELYFQTDWMYQSDMQFLLYDAIEFHSGDIFEGGVRAGFAASSGRWDLSVFGRNITDEENIKGVIDFNNNTAFVNDRRIWGINFRVNFGESVIPR